VDAVRGDQGTEARSMIATFTPGHRYRVRFSLPKFIEPRTILNALRNDICDVVVSDVRSSTVTIEATWRGARRTISTDYLLEHARLSSPSKPPSVA